MAVKLVTKTKKKVAKSNPLDTAVIEAVEDMASYKPIIAEGQAAQKKYDAKRNFLKGLIPQTADPLEPVSFDGTEHKAVFGAAQNERTIKNPKAIHKLLGDDVFYSIVKLNLKDLDAYLTPEEQKGVVEETVGTTRICKIEEL